MTDTPKPPRKRRTKAELAEATRLAAASPATDAPARPEAESRHAALVRAVEAAPGPGLSPSLAIATAFEVDRANYSKHEQAQAKLAMDFNGVGTDALSFVQATGFPGFATLSLLGQLAEYRVMHEALADECVRKWGRVVTSGNSDPARIRDIEAELERLGLKAAVRQLVVDDQAYGGGHAFFKMKGDDVVGSGSGSGGDTPRELPLVAKPFTVRKGSFEAIRVVEPRHITPNTYNATDPTRADFFKPVSWWLMSVKVHASRLYTIVSRPVSDMLKPAYSFRGISLTQLAMPYVDNWLRTRQSVSDTVKQFSVSGIATDLAQSLAPGAGTDLAMRAMLINAYRDNRNLLFLDKATEEFFQVNTPLTGLDAVQAQSQEHMSAVSQTPLVKLTGITPAGLNASSDGEIRVWYDRVGGYCKNVLGPFIKRVLELTQLSLDGQVDEHLSWEWNPLHELTALEEAERRAKDAATAATYIEATVISAEQEMERLANDPTSGYAGILNRPASPEDFEDTDVAGIVDQLLEPMAAEAETQAAQAMDAWTEGDHPRADNGQFGSGGSGKKAPTVKLKEGQSAVAKPFAVEKDPWGDYTAPGINGSLPKQYVTVKNGMVVGMHPSLAKNTGTEVSGEAQAKSEKTLQKEAAVKEAAARQTQEREDAAAVAVFQMRLSSKLAAVPEEKRADAQRELSEILTNTDLPPAHRVAAANQVLKEYGA